MIYNSVSIKQVISKVLTDNDMQEETHRISDFIEWAGEALEKIGAFAQLETKVTGKGEIPLLEIQNYQATLPVGLHGIIQAAYKAGDESTAPLYSMRYGTGSFDAVKGITIVDTDDGMGNVTYTTRDENYMETDSNIDYTYVIAGSYIKTNMKEGFLMLSYTCIPLDDDGYPMVPNDMAFLDALYWYITMKLYYPKWAEGRMRDAVYYDARSSWNYYRKQAYGNAMMPNGDMMESIKNTWNRLVPEMKENDTFFSTVGQEQYIHNNTNSNANSYPVLY